MSVLKHCIVLIPSKPIFPLTSSCHVLIGEVAKINFIVWSDPNETRTYDLRHPRSAHQPLHDRCVVFSSYGMIKRHVYLWTCFRIRTMYPSEATCLPVDLFQNQNNVSKWSDMSTCGLASESEQCIQMKRHVYLWTCFRIRTMYPSEATCLPVDLFQWARTIKIKLSLLV
jgi:hypothetical protein